jgi:hypothetical protein
MGHRVYSWHANNGGNKSRIIRDFAAVFFALTLSRFCGFPFRSSFMFKAISGLFSPTPSGSPASRRGFFMGAATVGAAAAAVVALPRVDAPAVVAAAPLPVPERGGGYSESAHVKRYYQTTRL